jgi:non-ribosomal peptide synthetase component F
MPLSSRGTNVKDIGKVSSQGCGVITSEYQHSSFSTKESDTTTSTLIRAAWAIIASHYTSSEDVVFGVTVTGRNAAVAGIDAITGLTIATVPVRVRMQGDWTVSALLEAVQQQVTEMIPYEQTGLQRIAKMGEGARHACGFQTLIVVQPAEDELGADEVLGEWRGHFELGDFTTYALMLQCTLAADGVRVTASFDARVLGQWQVEKMLGQFSFVLEQLTTATAATAAADSETRVADVDTLVVKDRKQLWAWNSKVPAAVERCVHDLFADQAAVQPEAPAICAWDGELTYAELDEL